MVIAGVLTIGALVAVAIIFNEPIGRFLNQVTGKSQAETDKQKIIDERGAFNNTLAFLFGESLFARQQAQAQDDQFKLAQRAQEAEIRKQAKSVGLSVDDFLKSSDISTNPFKFNPEGLIGFGILAINGGKGIPDTAENRLIINSIVSPMATSGGKRGSNVFFN